MIVLQPLLLLKRWQWNRLDVSEEIRMQNNMYLLLTRDRIFDIVLTIFITHMLTVPVSNTFKMHILNSGSPNRTWRHFLGNSKENDSYYVRHGQHQSSYWIPSHRLWSPQHGHVHRRSLRRNQQRTLRFLEDAEKKKNRDRRNRGPRQRMRQHQQMGPMYGPPRGPMQGINSGSIMARPPGMQVPLKQQFGAPGQGPGYQFGQRTTSNGYIQNGQELHRIGAEPSSTEIPTVTNEIDSYMVWAKPFLKSANETTTTSSYTFNFDYGNIKLSSAAAFGAGRTTAHQPRDEIKEYLAWAEKIMGPPSTTTLRISNSAPLPMDPLLSVAPNPLARARPMNPVPQQHRYQPVSRPIEYPSPAFSDPRIQQGFPQGPVGGNNNFQGIPRLSTTTKLINTDPPPITKIEENTEFFNHPAYGPKPALRPSDEQVNPTQTLAPDKSIEFFNNAAYGFAPAVPVTLQMTSTTANRKPVKRPMFGFHHPGTQYVGRYGLPPQVPLGVNVNSGLIANDVNRQAIQEQQVITKAPETTTIFNWFDYEKYGNKGGSNDSLKYEQIMEVWRKTMDEMTTEPAYLHATVPSIVSELDQVIYHLMTSTSHPDGIIAGHHSVVTGLTSPPPITPSPNLFFNHPAYGSGPREQLPMTAALAGNQFLHEYDLIQSYSRDKEGMPLHSRRQNGRYHEKHEERKLEENISWRHKFHSAVGRIRHYISTGPRQIPCSPSCLFLIMAVHLSSMANMASNYTAQIF